MEWHGNEFTGLSFRSCSLRGSEIYVLIWQEQAKWKEIRVKHIVAAIVSMGLLFGVCFAADKLELKDQKDKESYSLGYQFGNTLKSQGVDLNLDIYTSGIRDALGGKEPQMSQEEIRATIMDLQKRAMAAQQKSLKDQGDKNLAEGKAFLAENGKKKEVKTLPSGLQCKVLSEGAGKTPTKSDTVTVHYRGTFMNGTEFDSSIARGQPATFKVDGVIPGWTEALQLMKEGAKWQLVIPPELAYGEKGMPPRVPPQSTLIFEVELISVK
jgi:FKBP-type peptidyl-prolyl cis-trans isomerase FklB